MNSNIIEAIEREKIIAIIRGVKKEKLFDLANALYLGGIRIMELTYKADGTEDDEISENIKMLSEKFSDKMIIGAGTVLTEKQVKLTAKANGRFIISPDTNPKIIKKTKRLGMISIPGALTPTEAASAYRAGADFVKLFPISVFGKDYIKAVAAPLSDIKFLAVGGINESNVKEYLDGGAAGVGIGANIINKTFIENGNFAAITELAKKYVELSRN